MMKYLYVMLMISFVGLGSCEKEHLKDTVTVDAELAKELRSNPETIALANNNLVLETYLWRDFMPVSPPSGSKMIGVGKLTDVNQVRIPQSITLRKQYVIKGDEIWIANYGEIRNSPEHILEGVVRNGPQWDTGIEVDVVCEFQHQGKTYRLLAKSQPINATY